MKVISESLPAEIAEQIERAVNWTIGGFENSLADGYVYEDNLPSPEELTDEVYDDLMHATFYEGGVGPGPIPAIAENPNPVYYKAIISMLIARMYMAGELDWMGWD